LGSRFLAGRVWRKGLLASFILALSAAAPFGAAKAQTPTQADPGVIFREQLPRPDY
jgi:hypothetical protein